MKKGCPALAAMLRSIVREMAALAKRGQVALPVIGRIVIEVGAGENDPRKDEHWLACKLGQPQLLGQAFWRCRPTQAPAAAVAPAPTLIIVPPTIAQMPNLRPMWPVAMLAPTLGAIEPDER